jgi:hypothetical protein
LRVLAPPRCFPTESFACRHVVPLGAAQEMKPGGKIAWEFRLEKKDIGLSASFQRWETLDSEPTTQSIIEYEKIFAVRALGLYY